MSHSDLVTFWKEKRQDRVFSLYKIKFGWHLVFGMYLVFSHPSIQWKEHQSTTLSFHPKGWRYWQILKYLSANAKNRFLKSRGWSQKFVTGLNVTIGVDEKIYEWQAVLLPYWRTLTCLLIVQQILLFFREKTPTQPALLGPTLLLIPEIFPSKPDFHLNRWEKNPSYTALLRPTRF